MPAPTTKSTPKISFTPTLVQLMLLAVALLVGASTVKADPIIPPKPQPFRADILVPPNPIEMRQLIGINLPDGVLQRASQAYHQRSIPPTATSHPGVGALSGRRIGLSMGHGNRWVERNDAGDLVRQWLFQRDLVRGLREDMHTAQWGIDYLYPMFERAGADVVTMRERTYGEYHILVDNDAPHGYSDVGDWQTSTYPGYDGGTYRFSYLDPAGSCTARWNFQVPEDGDYPIYVYYLSGTNRNRTSRYRIVHAFGESHRQLNQADNMVESFDTAWYPNTPPPSDANRAPSDIWRYLGTFPFKAGEAAFVELSNRGDDSEQVVIADAIWVGGGMGSVTGTTGTTSGQPRWLESASTFLEWLDVPSWMRVGDVSIRPLYGIYRGIDAFISVHTNCCNSSGTSTWTWYPEMWVPQRSWPANFTQEQLPPGTFELASAVHREVIAQIREHWLPTWTDQGHWGANFGELRSFRLGWYEDVNTHGISPPMAIPALLLELAYHDMAHDVAYIRETGFRRDVARGILVGTIRYFNGTDAQLPPVPPAALHARADDDGTITVSWQLPVDPLAPEAAEPEGYRVYLSSDGLLFDPVRIVTDQQQAVIQHFGCEPLYFIVTAFNEAGESLDSTVIGAAHAREGGARILFVDGVEREIKLAADPNNPRTYARIYGPALSEVIPGAGFDMATNNDLARVLEARSYDLIVWAVGETSTHHETISSTEQGLVRAFLSSGTPLILSGAEIGWDLVERGSATDTAFFEEVLQSIYVADGAGTTIFDGSPLGLSSSIVFGDCSADAVCVEWPDVLDAVTGGQVLIQYSTGTGAATLSPDGMVLLAGFPLESIADPLERLALISSLAELMLDPDLAVGGDCPEYVEPPIEEELELPLEEVVEMDVPDAVEQDFGPDLPLDVQPEVPTQEPETPTTPTTPTAQVVTINSGCGCQASIPNHSPISTQLVLLCLGLFILIRRSS